MHSYVAPWFVFAVAVAAQEALPPSTVTIEGRVVDMRGDAVPAARIRVTSTNGSEDLASGVADAAGRFHLDQVPKQPSLLRVVAEPAHGRCVGVGWAGRSGEPVRIVVHDAASVQGVVRDRAGAPVADVVVQATSNASVLASAWIRVRTDAGGCFEMQGVPLGEVHFAAVVPDQGLARSSRSVTGDTKVTLAVDDEPTVTLRLVVVGLPPEEVNARATFWVQGGGSPRDPPPPWDHFQLDAKGVCERAHMPSGRYDVTPWADGYGFEPIARYALEPSEGRIEARFTAYHEAEGQVTHRVRLCDPDGKPLPGVRLCLGGARTFVFAASFAVTDERGCATFLSPVPAREPVRVSSCDDRWTITTEPMRPIAPPEVEAADGADDEPAPLLELAAEPACSVRGRVVIAGGAAAGFARVRLQVSDPDEGWVWAPASEWEADREGAFVLHVRRTEAARYQVCIASMEGTFTSEPFTMSRAGTRLDLGAIELRPPATVDGVVRLADGSPAAGVPVFLTPENSVWDQLPWTSGAVVTDRLGRYRFVGVPAGVVTLTSTLTDEQEPFEVAPGEVWVRDLVAPTDTGR